MAWHNIDVAGWNELEKSFEDIETIADNSCVDDDSWLYRGQADAAWELRDSLTRNLGERIPLSTALKIEKESMDRFREQAHLFLDPHTLPTSTDSDAWWPLMQHFGAPTRLLDWTLSPYVAAYFAVVDLWDKSGAVWLFREMRLLRTGLEILGLLDVSKPGEDAIFFSEDSPEGILTSRQWNYPTIRVVSQQGRFTLPFRILSDHGILIARQLRDDEMGHIKITIAAEAKPAILRKLSQMNITANSLYPGLDGLGRSIKEYAKLRSIWSGRGHCPPGEAP